MEYNSLAFTLSETMPKLNLAYTNYNRIRQNRIIFRGRVDEIIIARRIELKKIWQAEAEVKREREQFSRTFRSWVYFVQRSDELVKIGRSGRINLWSRFLELEYRYGDLRFLGAFECDPKKENELHRKFSRFRIEGEWFKPAQPILDFIKTDCHREYKDVFSYWFPPMM